MQTEIEEGKSIFDFKKGDILIRLKPAKGTNCRSFMDEPVRLLTIENNNIYLQVRNGFFRGQRFNVSLDEYLDNWDYYKAVDIPCFEEQFKDRIGRWLFNEDGNITDNVSDIKGFLHAIHLINNDFFTEKQREKICS